MEKAGKKTGVCLQNREKDTESITKDWRLRKAQFNLLTYLSVYWSYQRKDIYIEHRAGKTPCLASWRKMTQPGEFCW
jgi:hypothetical protein